MDKMLPSTALRNLSRKDPNVCGRYDDIKHTLTVYRVVSSGTTWEEWQRTSESLRNDICTKDTTIGIRVADKSAPALLTEPHYAVVYVPAVDRFVGAVNICTVLRMEFEIRSEAAAMAAAEASLMAANCGELPQDADMDCPVFYPSGSRDIDGLVRRINR